MAHAVQQSKAGYFLPPEVFPPFEDVVSIDQAVLDHWLEQTTIDPVLARIWHLQGGWKIRDRVLLSDWMIWVRSGAVMLETDGTRRSETIRAGELFVLPAGVLHEAGLIGPGPVELVSVHFRARLFTEMSLLELVGLKGLFRCAADSPIGDAMQSLCREDAVRAPGFLGAMRAEILRVLLYLLRHHGRSLNRHMSRVRYDHLIRLQPVLKVIESQLASTSLSVPGLADELAVSESYLRRLFRMTFGIPPAQYIQRRRIERAGQLLQDTRLGVKEVSRLSGFNEEHFFMHVFRKWTRQTPTEFRRRHSI
jgi:AraC-like DNA-binding protein